jgi:putative hemolysin
MGRGTTVAFVSGIGLEVLIILLLVIVNGAFAMAEIAVVSSRQARLQQKANAGDVGARTALGLARNPGHFLATIQIGITLVGIFAGAFGGATIAAQVEERLNGIPSLAPYSTALSVGGVVIAITFLTLVIGELVPKRLALHNPEGIASVIAVPMRALSVVASPIVWLLSASTSLVLRLLLVRPSKDVPVTEEEIRTLMQQGAEAGVFEEAERAMVGRIFRLGDLRVSALMTPRPDMVWLDVNDPPEQVRADLRDYPHSIYPVTEGGLDNVVGVVRARDLLARSVRDGMMDLRAVLQPPLFVPESMTALQVMELFKVKGTNMALIVDEYGGIEGTVTLHDLLEGIVGDIPSHDGMEEPPAVRRDDGSWLLDGQLLVNEVNDLLGMKVIPDERDTVYNTVAGFIISELGRIPMPGDHIAWKGLRFEVLDMDGNRVDKVLVAKEG